MLAAEHFPPAEAPKPAPAVSKTDNAISIIALEIIETVLKDPGSWGVSELAKELDLPKARVHRHLTQLRSAGYVSQNDSTRRYEPGWRLAILGQQLAKRVTAVTVARPVMEKLRDEVRQTIVFGQFTDHGVTVVSVLPGGSPIDVVLHPGTQFGFNASAQGKVALAFGSPSQIEQWSRQPHETRTARTVTDPAQLEKDVETTRQRGWTYAPEETYLGVNAIAAPVLGHGGALIGTLAIIASIHFVPDPPSAPMVEALVGAALELSRDFGHQRATDSQ